MSIRARLNRLRRRQPVQPPPVAAPIYRVLSGGSLGCRFCTALRELLSTDWEANESPHKELWREGGCFFNVEGRPYVLVEAGPEFSLFQMVDLPGGTPTQHCAPLWFRNADLGMEGANEPAERGPRAPWSVG